MKTFIVNERLMQDERECVLNYLEIDGKWTADVSVRKLRTRFIKQGWTETSQTTLSDGTWVASTFEAPYWGISIRSPKKQTRELTEEQKEALKRARESRNF